MAVPGAGRQGAKQEEIERALEQIDAGRTCAAHTVGILHNHYVGCLHKVAASGQLLNDATPDGRGRRPRAGDSTLPTASVGVDTEPHDSTDSGILISVAEDVL